MNNNSKWKVAWLLSFIILVIIMISVGGITRLTKSGLSIVEWNPVIGALPPLTESDWQKQFNLYQESPEFKQVNFNFRVEDYKKIFVTEYLHRLIGRVIFLFALIPGFILYRKKIVSLNLVLTLTGLVAIQGLVGWLMVKSGLNTNPHVSPYFLAMHFFLALILLLTAYYPITKLRKPLPVRLNRTQRALIVVLGISVCLQVFYGCLTSGWKAGFIFNTYPLMGGHFFPVSESFFTPTWINAFESPALVQWTHRWLGLFLFTMIISTAISILRSKSHHALRGPFIHFVGITAVQIILGILNIVLTVPLPLAVIHQVLAVLIVMAYFNILFRMKDCTSIIVIL
ncbi:MAG: COX15/CtaA family protein [Pseudobdellovibrio sp.]